MDGTEAAELNGDQETKTICCHLNWIEYFSEKLQVKFPRVELKVRPQQPEPYTGGVQICPKKGGGYLLFRVI